MFRHSAFVVAAFFAMVSSAHANCDKPVLPDASSKHHWFCANDSDTVVVFVHGLISNNRTTWWHEDAKDTSRNQFWPRLVLEDPAFERPERSGLKPSVFLAGYYTEPSSTIYRMVDAQEELYRMLSLSADGQPPIIEKRNIMFVAHSLGGILTRDMLARRAKDFVGKRVGLLLVGSPSKGSNLANVGRIVQWAVGNQLVEELEKDSDYLDDVHARFLRAISAHGALESLVGGEIYEHRNLSLITGLLAGRIVERESAVVYWPPGRLIVDSNHSTVAHPTDINHPSHAALREVYQRMAATEIKACDPPRDLKLTVDIVPAEGAGPVAAASAPRVADFQLLQLDVASGSPIRGALALMRDQVSGLYRAPLAEPPFPCRGERFWARISRAVPTSIRMLGDSPLTDLCFRRSRSAGERNSLFLRCKEGQLCDPDVQEPGLAVICGKEDRSNLVLVQGGAEWSSQAHWNVPSLETLDAYPEATRPAYTEFIIKSEPLLSLDDAIQFGFGVKVNGVPLFMDGLPPFADRRSFSRGGRIHLAFAIENLGFNGGIEGDGRELIQVEIRFYDGNQQQVASIPLERRYVSYRHAPLENVPDPVTGEQLSWSGIYRPTASKANYEVMLETASTADWIKTQRANLDSAQKSIAGSSVIGVVRPGRLENPRMGLIIGLREPTGQVRSLFPREQAIEICRWIQREPDFTTLQREGAYIFEFPHETFSDQYDRGRRHAFCRDV